MKERLFSLISKSFSEYESLTEYKNYAPIFNSELMLREIRERSKANLELSLFEVQKINVGLLAAKSLDFDDRFSQYALSLHQVWASFLVVIRRPRSIPTSGNELKAYKFYEQHMYPHEKIMDHLDGIDFRSPIDDRHELNKNCLKAQWKALNIPQGNYYADLGKYPDCLGIYSMQEDYLGNASPRIEHQFMIQSKDDEKIIALKTIAAAVLDTWSIKGHKFRTKGGCIQYFNANDKLSFVQKYP